MSNEPGRFGSGFIYLFFRNKHIHRKERKRVLTQKHTTTPLKNHDNF